MKHSLVMILILVGIFLVSHIFGLFVTQSYIDASGGWMPLPGMFGVPFERPVIASNWAVVYVFSGIILGTLLVLFFVRFNGLWLWRLWFFLAVLACMYVSLFVFLPSGLALPVSFLAAFLKVFRPSVIIHNATEVLVYGGLSAIFVPLFDVFSVFVLLVLISLYDAYAVWKSRHMIALAKFQMKSKLFAGLLVPYKLPSGNGVVKGKVRSAVLGGGDIAFPLLFSGVILSSFGFWQALLISFSASIALFLLMYFGQRAKFYPAMPFISAGCFVGYGVILLAQSL